MTTHGHRSGNWKSATYSSWQAMIARCHNPKHPFFADYGGRGIIVCARWRGPGGFERFLSDLGERPEGMTLDRLNVNGNYEPENVRWNTLVGQRWNRRDMVAGGGGYWINERAIEAREPQPDIPF